MRAIIAVILILLLNPAPTSALDVYYSPDLLVLEVNRHYQEMYDGMGMGWTPPTVVWITPENDAESECGTIPAGFTLASYCWLDETIFIDEVMMNDVREKDDVLPFLVLSHEYGHHAENMAGWEVDIYPISDRSWSDVYLPHAELAADCLAGTFLGKMGFTGKLDSDDVSQALVFTESSGDTEGDGDPHPAEIGNPWAVHGSGQQRVEAVLLGYQYGLVGCLTIQPFAED